MSTRDDLESILDSSEELSSLAARIEQERKEREVKVESASFRADQIINFCKESLDFFAGFLMPDIFKYFFPPVFIQLWTLLTEVIHRVRDFTKIAIGLPRGLGKTTLIKLFILYIIFFTDRHFIAIYSSREGLAENILSDVEDFLDAINVKQVFGDWRIGVETDTKQMLTFGFRGRDIIITALGAGTSMRGMNLKNRRPDVMIFDDIQTQKCAESEVESSALERWMVGTAMKAKDNERCLFIFIANMYPQATSILKKLKYNPEWISFIAGAILATGESIWEEMKPIKELHAELRSDIAMGHPEIFFAEVLNDETAGQKSGVDIAKIPKVPYIDGIDYPDGKFILIDPASGKINGDNVEIGYVEVYDRIPVLRKLVSGKFSPGQTIKEALTLAIDKGAPLIAVEDTAYQSTLLYWFNIIADQLDIKSMQFVPVSPRGRAKNSRILVFFKQLLPSFNRETQEISPPETYLDDEVKPLVFFEIAQFNPAKRDNLDNKLDIGAYLHQVVEENFWAIQTPLSMTDDGFEKSSVKSLAENCAF